MLLPGASVNARAAGEDTALCAFSPGRDVFALSSSDGRVRLFDTGSGRLQQQLGDATPAVAVGSSGSGDVAQRCTALAWLPAAPAAATRLACAAAWLLTSEHPRSQGRTPKRKAAASAGGDAVIVGTRDGSVCSWDAAAGEQRWCTLRCHDSAVVSLACAPRAGVLYAAAAGGIAELASPSGAVQQTWAAGQQPITCIALSSDGLRLLVASAGCGLALWDTTSRRRVRKLAGHSSAGAGAHSLAFSPSGGFAVSAAAGDRAVAVWDIAAATAAAPAGAKQSPAAAVTRLPLPEGTPVQLVAAPCGSGDDAFTLCAVSDVGEAFVWSCAPGGVPRAAARRIRIGPVPPPGRPSARECVLSVILEDGFVSGTGSVFLARGSAARATFERVSLDDGEDVIALAPSAKGLLLDAPGAGKSARASAAAAAAAAAAATVHGADNAVDAAMPRPAENGLARKHVAAHANGGSPPAAAPAARHAPAGAAGDQSLGERLRALELAAVEADAGAAGSRPSAAAAAAFDGEVPRADSLAVLLAQALASSDAALLERVLSVSDRKVAANTVARLRPEQALAFLAAAVLRLQTSPARGARLAHWIRETLAAHAGYLTAAPGARPLLAALYGVLDARLALYRPLLSLSGRLDLLLAAQKRAASGLAGTGAASAEPVEYEEPEDGEPEDVRGGLGSDDDDDDEAEEEEEAGPGSDADSDGLGDLGEEEDAAWHTDDDDA